MATIRISVGQEGRILIEPVGEISTEEWLSLSHWWASDSTNNLSPGQISVSPSEFAYKKFWLRENWTRLGNNVDLAKEVIASVKAAEGLINDFGRLSTNQDRSVDLNSLNTRLKRELTPFQICNVNNLVTMNNGANFSVPGAGKTSTTLAVWEYFRASGKIQRLLVICPRSAFEAWEKEPELVLQQSVNIHQFSEESIPPNTELLYVNYEQLENKSRLLRLTKWMDSMPTMLALDEAHRVKGGGKSIRWKACADLCAHAVRVDLLTGTPMPQSQEDLKNLFELSWQGIPRHYFTNEKLSNLKRGGVFVRTTKKELELPPMKIELISVRMSPLQNDIYSALRRTFAGQFGISDGDYGYFEKKGKAVMSLLAAATNPGLLMRSYSEEAYLGFNWPPINLSGDERLISVLNKYSSHEISEKYLWIVKFVSKAASEGRKILIWSTFIGNLLALKKLLEPFEPAVIYGGTNIDERKLELERFRHSPSCTVLLSNPQTLGEGVSLHKECHEAIYVDRNYNAGLYLQSLDRIHRLGLTADQKTTIYLLQSEGSIDVRVGKRLEAKIDRLGAYLNDTGLVEVSLPTGEPDDLPDSLIGLDDLDLNDLLDHLRNDGI
jgi:SNF2 family DNA or RNA helicase